MPAQGRISTVKEAWDAIDAAGKVGTFVPVLAFELACLPQYNLTRGVSSGDHGLESRQLQQLALQVERCARAVGILRGTGESPQSQIEMCATRYLENLTSNLNLDKPPAPAEAPSRAQDGTDMLRTPVFDNLVTNLARLATALTSAWARHLATIPIPVRFGRDELVVPASLLSSSKPPITCHLRQSLNCCAVLYDVVERQGERREEPNSLKMKWVYEKLLLFASEVFGQEAVWQEGDACDQNNLCCGVVWRDTFRERHSKFIRVQGERTGWNYELRRVGREDVGVRVSHLQWLQGLLKHLLLAGTRAYRTRSELAFLLLLDDEARRLPDAATDPFEMGLLLGTERDKKTLTDVLAFCEALSGAARPDASGSSHGIHPFYGALARFLRQERAVVERNRVREVRSRSRRQVVVSMGFDREMERALAHEFDRFRIALPVRLPILDTEHDMEHEPVAGPVRRTPTASWLVGECVRTGTPLGYRVQGWVPFGDEQQDGSSIVLEHDGPLVVKLFGSPLEDVGDAFRESHKESGTINPNGVIEHRLVLDETALLSSLVRCLPDGGDLGSYLSSNSLFFFGQDALRWSERVPYSLVRFLDPPKQVEESLGDGPVDASRSSSKTTVSFGKPGVIGAFALDKLQVRYVEGEASAESVIQRFIEEVARRG